MSLEIIKHIRNHPRIKSEVLCQYHVVGREVVGEFGNRDLNPSTDAITGRSHYLLLVYACVKAVTILVPKQVLNAHLNYKIVKRGIFLVDIVNYLEVKLNIVLQDKKTLIKCLFLSHNCLHTARH